MLAYVFWHRPRGGVDAADYEAALRAFHDAVDLPSASFRLARLPFDDPGGYEDWYLVNDWAGLGELNGTAVDAVRRPPHDRAASLAADGWGGIYALLRGVATIPDGTEWLHKPRGEPYERFLASQPHGTIWQRQMTLGPGPEFCAATPRSAGRERI